MRSPKQVGGASMALGSLLGENWMEAETGGYWVEAEVTSLWVRCIEVVDVVDVIVLVEVIEGEALKFASWELHHTEPTGSPRRLAVNSSIGGRCTRCWRRVGHPLVVHGVNVEVVERVDGKVSCYAKIDRPNPSVRSCVIVPDVTVQVIT